MEIFYQQGDVKIHKIKEIPSEAKPLKHLILAEGEMTGHKHQISKGQAMLLAVDTALYLKVLSDNATVKHDEHIEIDVPKGDYEIQKVKEYDHFKEEVKNVQD